MRRTAFRNDPREFIERNPPANTTESTPERAILVLRFSDKEGKVRVRIWHARTPELVTQRAYDATRRKSLARPKRIKAWGARQDDVLLYWYELISKEELAKNLSLTFKRRYTKNMVISRYHRLIERKRRDSGS